MLFNDLTFFRKINFYVIFSKNFFFKEAILKLIFPYVKSYIFKIIYQKAKKLTNSKKELFQAMNDNFNFGINNCIAVLVRYLLVLAFLQGLLMSGLEIRVLSNSLIFYLKVEKKVFEKVVMTYNLYQLSKGIRQCTPNYDKQN